MTAGNTIASDKVWVFSFNVLWRFHGRSNDAFPQIRSRLLD